MGDFMTLTLPAATEPRDDPTNERLLVIDPTTGRHKDRRIADLADLLRAGDLLVVNDAATLPGSLHAENADGEPVEVRLAAGQNPDGRFTAVLLGRGDWRTRTEDRPAPPELVVGETLRFGPDLHAGVEAVSSISSRLVEIRFDLEGAALWAALYRHGRPVQYAYLSRPLALWDVQTAYATRPWAAECPSAGRPLTLGLLAEIRARGVEIATLTHAAGLSSTGDQAIDAALPLPERYELPAATVEAIERARACGGRVIAVGTSVARALEGNVTAYGPLTPTTDVTGVRLGPTTRRRVVDGLLTGLHEPGGSHFELLQSFVEGSLLQRAYSYALLAGYLWHELGDSNLILAGTVD